MGHFESKRPLVDDDFGKHRSGKVGMYPVFLGPKHDCHHGGEVYEICLYQMEKVPDWIQESILLLTTY